MDVVYSSNSIFTAVGLVDNLWHLVSGSSWKPDGAHTDEGYLYFALLVKLLNIALRKKEDRAQAIVHWDG